MKLVEQFEREFQPLVQGDGRTHGGFARCASYVEAAEAIAGLALTLDLQRLLVAPRPEFEGLRRELAARLGEPRVVSDHPGRSAEEYEGFDAGVGGADVLVAESASLALVSPGPESPLLSLLPETHIVVAPASRVVPRIHDALARLHGDAVDGARSLVFVTGPSRTADIEKILVLPAHGPARLQVYLIEGL